MIRTYWYAGWSGLKMAALTMSIACAPLLSSIAGATTLDSGTVIPVRLNSSLSSRDSQQGDTFTATLRSDSNQNYGLPDGTRVEGVVRMARPQEGNTAGELDLDFRRLILPNGEAYPLRGSLIGLDNKSVTRTSDGRLVATPSHKNDRLTYVGYGAGAGLIIGALTKHTLEDTLLGGGLGYLFGSLQKGHSNARDVNLKAGTELGVRLDRRLTLTSYDNGADNGYIQDNGNGRRYHRMSPTPQGDSRFDNTSDIGVMIDNQNVRFDSTAPPIMSHGVVLVPVRPVLNAMDVPYHYSAASKALRATSDFGSVRIALGSSIAVTGDGRRTQLDAPVQRRNGTIYAPIRFFELATGSNVSYDADSRTVMIQTSGNQ